MPKPKFLETALVLAGAVGVFAGISGYSWHSKASQDIQYNLENKKLIDARTRPYVLPSGRTIPVLVNPRYRLPSGEVIDAYQYLERYDDMLNHEDQANYFYALGLASGIPLTIGLALARERTRKTDTPK
jgi:hypothetical protein